MKIQLIMRHNWLALLIIATLFGGCSQTRTLGSTYVTEPIQIDGSIADWPRDGMVIETSAEFDIYFANNEEFLFVYLVVKSQQIFNDIEQFGLTLFFDTDRRARRQFGVVYPIGIFNFISNVPGARQEYLENPGWAGFQENQRLIEAYRQEADQRVMLIQRTGTREQIRPISVNKDALTAQGLELSKDPESRLLNIEMKIPLQPNRARQFAIEADAGTQIYVGFEIRPPTPDEIMRDGGSALAEGQGGTMRRQQEMAQRSQMQLRGEFSRWMRVNLASP
ncbi:MAG: hypothetical protein JJU41_08565 [Bacteroidetes bacterium]|nr:hypothetical protein [Bacteroidota bacterium]MCH8523417.1 hypothetical protein [Balneolales bacterium]